MNSSRISDSAPHSSLGPGVGAEGIKPMDYMRIARSAGGALLAQASLHGQLACVEWAEEKSRLLKLLFITLLGFACLLSFMLLGAAFLLVIGWKAGYLLVSGFSLLALFASGFMLTCIRFRQLAAQSDQAFAATREELAVDIAMIRSKL